MPDDLPPILQLHGKHYVHLTSEGAFLKVPRYAGFWELAFHMGYITFCHQVDQCNPTEYIGPHEMSTLWSILCHHYHPTWINGGNKTPEQKVACLQMALLRPTDEAIVGRMSGYWANKKQYFRHAEELIDGIEPDQLQYLRGAGLITDNDDADSDSRPFFAPDCYSWPLDKEIGEDDFTTEELELMMAESKNNGEGQAAVSEPDPMDMSG